MKDKLKSKKYQHFATHALAVVLGISASAAWLNNHVDESSQLEALSKAVAQHTMANHTSNIIPIPVVEIRN